MSRSVLLGLKALDLTDKTRPACLLNDFKHDYKFNRYTALLVFFI